ncbi:SIR2 family protein [Microbacterium profundi]|uniref:SIR2 family protein n=1 Tax=Microbacterium profundi TaxID=450380 RepID=UPI001F1CF3E7|nr:SIR2 family protein [Microbacterium profundi]MCE7482432.1 SIR2 family protein [Microbacterium profundi]
MTAEPVRTVPAVLERFDSSFSAFATAFNEGQYVLWLGSGISRERVPNVGELLGRVAEHLRTNIVVVAEDCEYRAALDEVLRLAGLSTAELGAVDYSILFEEWPLKDRIVAALVTNYSRVLDVLVGDDNPEDYLVWTGLDIPNIYGAPDLEPDVEHYCIAILMLEGVVEAAVTANWDGLLEKALREFSPAFDALVRVAVKPDDFRVVGRRIEVIKVHGCAVRARDDEAGYRSSLVARHSQISTWTEQPQNRLMRKQLELRYAARLTLMVGLSAQDENFHTVFAAATQDLARSWPASPPAVVLSEERLESYHQSVLRTTYGATYQGNASAIKDSSLLGAYGKPVLLALVLSSLTEKLSFLVEHAIGSTWGSVAVKQLQADLLRIRDLVASHADPSDPTALERATILEFQRQFAARLVDVANFALTVFRTGRMPVQGGGRYEPLSDRPAAQAVLNADFPSKQFGRLGVALALIGRGLTAGQWTTELGHSTMAADGVIRLVNAQKSARVFFVRDATTLTQLELDASFDDSDGDVLIVVADEEPPTQTRSPRSRFGRDGRTSVGRFSVASTVADTESVDDLYEAFKLASGF